jgi:hypothetical protein
LSATDWLTIRAERNRTNALLHQHRQVWPPFDSRAAKSGGAFLAEDVPARSCESPDSFQKIWGNLLRVIPGPQVRCAGCTNSTRRARAKNKGPGVNRRPKEGDSRSLVVTADLIANNADTGAAGARALVDVEAVAAADDRRAIQVRVLVGGHLDARAVEVVFEPKAIVGPAARRERQRPESQCSTQRQLNC